MASYSPGYGSSAVTVSPAYTSSYGAAPVSVVESADEIIVSDSGARPVYYENAMVEPVTRIVYADPVVETMTTYVEPVRTYAAPVTRTYVGAPTTTYSSVMTQEPIFVHSATPASVTREVAAPVTYLESAPETKETDWVVVEKAPKTSLVRHEITNQVGGVRTTDGRYVIGDVNFGQTRDGSGLLSDYSEGILRLPDGRLKYADGTIGQASPSRVGLQGSVVALSDGSILLPDGTIEYPDGTTRKPTNATYSPSVEYSGQAWSTLQKNNAANLASLNEQIAQLKEQMKEEVEIIKSQKAIETNDLRSKLNELTAEKRIYEKELTIMKEQGPQGWSVAMEGLRGELRALQGRSDSPRFREAISAKEENLRAMHEQLLAEAKACAEARGQLQMMREERIRDQESKKTAISEAVLRREQDLLREKDRVVAELVQKAAAEREAVIAQERSHAQRVLEHEIATERERLRVDMRTLEDIADAEKKRAEEEQMRAFAERERAAAAEEQVARLSHDLDALMSKKKKKKKKGKRKAKGKAKAKAAGVLAPGSRLYSAPAPRGTRLVSKPAGRR